MITDITKTLHLCYPNIPIYTERITKPNKEHFELQIINSTVTATCNETYLESNLYSLVYVTDNGEMTNSRLREMKRELTFALRDFFYHGVDFTILNNELHCLFTLYETISMVEQGEFVDKLDIQELVE